MTKSDTGSDTRQLPDDTLLDLFEERMRQIWQRDAFDVADPDGTARLVRLLLGREGFGATSSVLARSGVRAEWNRVFARQRSRFLADWLHPYLIVPVLDVLGGDFTVLRALVDNGLSPRSTLGCERSDAYETDWSGLPFPVRDVPADLCLPAGPHGTALVCTVLHHEPDVRALLDAIDRTDAVRWVVVENCLDPQNSESFHLYVDEFFNHCLNTFNVPCVPQHRSAEDWRELLGRYGVVTVEETRADVPGMPFPYTLFVVDR